MNAIYFNIRILFQLREAHRLQAKQLEALRIQAEHKLLLQQQQIQQQSVHQQQQQQQQIIHTQPFEQSLIVNVC